MLEFIGGLVIGSIVMFFVFANNKTLLSRYADKINAEIDKGVDKIKDKYEDIKNK